MRIASCLFLSVLLAGCAGEESDDDHPPAGPATAEDGEAKADTAEGARRVRAGQLTLTVNSTTGFTDLDGQRALVIRASTSRRLESVFSYVPDDAFGEARLVDDTGFEVLLRDGHELNSILSGLPILVQIRTATGTIRDYTARIDLGARLAGFSGSNQVYLGAAIAPIYQYDPVNPLRYRVTVTTSADASSFSTDVAGAEVTLDTPRAAHVDLPYDAFAPRFGQRIAVTAHLVGAGPATKRARVDLRVVRIGLTTEDPYQVWPAPTCTDPTLACLVQLEEPARDWSPCGSYRETQACVHHTCEIIEPEPLSLEPIDASGLDASVAAFDGACPSGGRWCHLDRLEAFALPACRVSPIAYVVDEYLEGTQDPPYQGTVGDPGTSIFLDTSYSPQGPALRAAIQGWVGGAEAQAWIGVEEVPCHNCTDFVDRAILYFPAVGRVIVLSGGHGYDS